jgi:hypothetical protein
MEKLLRQKAGVEAPQTKELAENALNRTGLENCCAHSIARLQ